MLPKSLPRRDERGRARRRYDRYRRQRGACCQALARQINTIVVVTGEVDYITDGQRTRTVTGGDPPMTRVVGTGCALSVVAASCSLPGDRWITSLPPADG
jgi:hydroxyethylthiazole kinase-like sugar kinase family protein